MSDVASLRVGAPDEGAALSAVAEASAPAEGRCHRYANDERIQLMGLLIEANARLTRVLGAELEAASGLPLSWYDVLIRLRRSDGGRLTMTELATQTLLTSGGVTRLVDRIAEAGYVERQGCPSDRRSVYVVLTDAGDAALEAATVAHLEGLDRHLLGPLSKDEVQGLRVALEKLVGDGSVCGRTTA